MSWPLIHIHDEEMVFSGKNVKIAILEHFEIFTFFIFQI